MTHQCWALLLLAGLPEIDPELNGVHGQRWPQPLIFKVADRRGKHSTRVVLVYVFLGLIANTTVKIFPFLIKHITKTSLLARIIGVQALWEIFSNNFFFWHELEFFKWVSLWLWSKKILKKAPFEINVSWGIFFFPTLFIHLLFSSTLILFWECLHLALPSNFPQLWKVFWEKRWVFFFIFWHKD